MSPRVSIESDPFDLQSVSIESDPFDYLIRPVHERMPVILEPSDYGVWLNPLIQDPVQLQQLLVPYPSAGMNLYPVSNRVSSPANDDAELVQPLRG